MYAPLAVDQFPDTCTVLEAISIEIYEIVIDHKKFFCILSNRKLTILLYNKITHINCRTTTIMKSTLKVHNPRVIIILLLICINDVQGKELSF